jgi:hypothetical protein
VVAWACRITGDYELALDIAQDVFIKALTGIGHFRGTARRQAVQHHAHRAATAPGPRLAARGWTTAAFLAPPMVKRRVPHIVRDGLLVHRLIHDAKLQAIEARVFIWHHGYDLPLQAVTARLGLANRSGARASLVSATRKLRRSAARWQQLSRAGAATRAPQGSMSP